MIVTSPRFADMMRRVVSKYAPGADADNVARLIVGLPPPSLAYLGDIITGPFDADKLDYLVRDCYFTGIRADADVPRVILSAERLDRKRFSLEDYPKDSMVMLHAGVSNLEQVIFNKMLLFPSIYHHHKVRALECMVRGIFELIWDNPDRVQLHPKLRFASVKDFLEVSEHDFFALGSQEPHLQGAVLRLLHRDLLERCLVISMDYIESSSARKHRLFETSTEDNAEQIRKLRELIWDYLPKKWRTEFPELWIDLPKRPSIAKDADACFVDNNTDKLAYLRDYFPYPRWVESYQQRRWKGHVFYVSSADHRWAANRAAKSMLKELYGFRSWADAATRECKIP